MKCPFCGNEPVITRSSDIVEYDYDPEHGWIANEDGNWTRPMIEVGRKQSWHLRCGDHVNIYGHSPEEVIQKWETRV